MDFKSSELLTRALQIADMVDTSYLSKDEQVSLLNEAYRDLYQKAIDNGDLYFIKAVLAVDGMTLPDDFYQLYSVETEKGYQLDRKAKSEANTTDDKYEIVNEVLYIYGSAQNLKLIYYPKPPVLVVRETEQVLFTEKANDTFNTRAILQVETNANIIDIITGETIKTVALDMSLTPEELYLGNVLIGYYGSNQINIKDTRYNNTDPVDRLTSYDGYIVRSDNELLVLTKTGDLIDVKNNKTLLTGFIIPDGVNAKSTGVYLNDEIYLFSDTIYKLLTDGSNEVIEGEWKEASLPYVIDKDIYYDIYYTDIYGNIIKNFTELLTDTESVDFINGIINNNGVNYYSNGVLYPIGDIDTVVSYPNNLFWEFLSYKVAFYYKNKAGQNIEGVAYLLDEAEAQMFDSLSSDNNSFVRIKNVRSKARW